MFSAKRHMLASRATRAGFGLVRRKAPTEPRGMPLPNSTAANHFFHAVDRRARKGLAVNCTSKLPFLSNADLYGGGRTCAGAAKRNSPGNAFSESLHAALAEHKGTCAITEQAAQIHTATRRE